MMRNASLAGISFEGVMRYASANASYGLRASRIVIPDGRLTRLLLEHFLELS